MEVSVLMNIVPVHVLDLLGLDVPDSEQLHADNLAKRIVHRRINSSTGAPLEYYDL